MELQIDWVGGLKTCKCIIAVDEDSLTCVYKNEIRLMIFILLTYSLCRKYRLHTPMERSIILRIIFQNSRLRYVVGVSLHNQIIRMHVKKASQHFTDEARVHSNNTFFKKCCVQIVHAICTFMRE